MFITIFVTNSLTNKQIREMKKAEFRKERSALVSLIRELEINESQMTELLIKKDKIFSNDSLFITSKFKVAAFNRENSMNFIMSDSLITKLYEIYDQFDLSNEFYIMRSYENILPLTPKNLKKYEIGILLLSENTIEDCRNMIRELNEILMKKNNEYSETDNGA